MKRTNNAVWLEKYNRWQIKVQKDGIRKTFSSSIPGRAGKRECNEKADAWLDDNITQANKKVSALSEKYMEQLKLTTSQSHYNPYQSLLDRWILPVIGTVKIENLTEQHMQNVINKAFSEGKSKKTLENIRSCMLNFLKFCRKSKTTTLFVEGLTIPKGAKTTKRTILQPNDISKLYNCEYSTHYGKKVKEIYVNAFRLEVGTGLSPGEIMGLKWSDIKDRVINMERSINAYSETTSGKNENARRSFYLTDLDIAVLNSQKELCKEFNLKSEYVFCDEFGEHIKTQNYNKRWKKFCSVNEITHTTPYELRHTFVSATKSLPEGYLKQLVGHSKSMDTYGVYSHSMDGEQKAAAELVQNIFIEISKAENEKKNDKNKPA